MHRRVQRSGSTTTERARALLGVRGAGPPSSTEAVIRSTTVAAGLATTSAYTWLKLPVVDNMQAVLAATALPVVLLGGEVSDDQDAQFAAWSKALDSPNVRGMVVGRSLLFPPDGNVESAVDATVEMMTT